MSFWGWLSPNSCWEATDSGMLIFGFKMPILLHINVKTISSARIEADRKSSARIKADRKIGESENEKRRLYFL